MNFSVHKVEQHGWNEEDGAVFRIRIKLPTIDDG